MSVWGGPPASAIDMFSNLKCLNYPMGESGLNGKFLNIFSLFNYDAFPKFNFAWQAMLALISDKPVTSQNFWEA